MAEQEEGGPSNQTTDQLPPSNALHPSLCPRAPFVVQTLLRAPPAPPGPDFVRFDQFWVGTGGGRLPAPGEGALRGLDEGGLAGLHASAVRGLGASAVRDLGLCLSCGRCLSANSQNHSQNHSRTQLPTTVPLLRPALQTALAAPLC